MLGVISIIGFLMIFLYFKMRQYRSTYEAVKHSYASKASMAVGLFMISFAINSYVQLQTTIAAVILLLFLAMGGANIFLGYKNFKALQPHVEREMNQSS